MKVLLEMRHGCTPAGAECPLGGELGGPGEALAGERNLVKKASNVFFLSDGRVCAR
jgi:hypothetical protein